ncbi:universal stress protein [Spirilliplanes yamanashiensis]|uniref:Universal stress protein n=1 Tax=Spirilliplanes yamanashiensis TaxID=42233 RepID=A0A8J3Y6M5_9ACTN|nr:universal stress protein [Spirilliplanes yamanashiensis]MDP9817511.1 nucleotide-binding universal stress UspA family protein [Spirilliplanes yamanashiensis]GIJ02836.1 universal stress protein [Spirilliplanes yamanashiensis]
MGTIEIVVGTDGSAPATAAVRWAAEEAARRHAVLRIVHAADADVGEEIDGLLAHAESVVRSAVPHVPVRRQIGQGDPADVLLAAAARAALVVIGHRGRGGFASLLLGSVGHDVTTRSLCPVVVVRGKVGERLGSPVVVGLDGSGESAYAARLAFEHADAAGCGVLAVRAWQPITPWGPGMTPLPYDPDAFEAAERAALATDLAPWREKFPDVPVGTLVARGAPAPVLVQASTSARLVVAGSRGHGIAGTPLGSVGLHLLHHADCPVLLAHG